VSDTAVAIETKLFLVSAQDRKTSFTVPAEASADVSLRRVKKLRVAPGATVVWAFGTTIGEAKRDAQGASPSPG
jgi:hypothetical protein